MIELGRPSETIQYLASYWQDPLARYRLGRIHEELGEYDQAREAYEYFVEAWKHADPELQPMVEEARQAMIRLGKPTGSR